MNSYLLRIELKSDLCVSDGGVYNSTVDIEACFDRYGLPYIPAKRIKGLLRESADELRDWGLCSNADIEDLFGTPGNSCHSAHMTLRNAVLPESEEYIREIRKHRNSPVYHRQNITGAFSYIRSQTSVEYDTGVADDGSLRMMRVVNKGLEFYAPITLEGEADTLKKRRNLLEAAAAVTKHMGLGRTRGLGKIRMTVVDVPDKAESSPECGEYSSSACIDYTIKLLDPVICKSVRAGEAETQDYIEGGKVLGWIAEAARAQGMDFISLSGSGGLHVSDAFICNGNERCFEVPKSIYAIKNNDDSYIDQAVSFSGEETRQLNQMKHCYVSSAGGSYTKVDVETEEHYHHRRPEDKSIGRAIDDGSGLSTFYQMEAMSAGQVFKGSIYGKPEVIGTVCRLLSEKCMFRLGNAVSSEYGSVEVNLSGHTASTEPAKGKTVVVELISPAIVYGRHAFYSTNPKDLIAEVNCRLGIQGSEVDQCNTFIGYTTVGGYNVTWGRRKPSVEAFDKGTTLIYHFSGEREVRLPEFPFIGERSAEGFGEIAVWDIDAQAEREKKWQNPVKNPRSDTEPESAGTLAFAVVPCLLEDYLRSASVAVAKKLNPGIDERPTVSNLLLMCSEFSEIADVRDAVDKRYDRSSEKKREKKQTAEKILNDAEKAYETALQNFETLYKVSVREETKTKYRIIYLGYVLKQCKYLIRSGEKQRKRDAGGSGNEK